MSLDIKLDEDTKSALLYSSRSDIPGSVHLMQYMGEDGITQVNAARASFMKEVTDMSPRDYKLLEYCAREKHTSVFEHNMLTFRFKVPLFVARQHHRHRTWSYNEVSRRYTSEALDFYLPRTFRKQAASNRQASVDSDEIWDPTISEIHGTKHIWPLKAHEAGKQITERSVKFYNAMLEAGICREEARMFLPQNLYTTYWGTVNLNNFFKFYELRSHEGAQKEIVEVAEACMALVKLVWPDTVQTYFNSKKPTVKSITNQINLLSSDELQELISSLNKKDN